MRYPVKIYEVGTARDGRYQLSKPQLVQEFNVTATNLEAVRKSVESKLKEQGREIRSLSFSPQPAPNGSVVVYVKDSPRKIRPLRRQEKPNSTQPKKRRRS